MTNPTSYSAAEIEKTAQALKRLRPAYRDLLDFYKEIFMAQETAVQGIQLEPVPIPEQVLSIKVKEGFPLVTRQEFVVEKTASADLLKTLCRIALHAHEKLATSAEGLKKAVDSGRLDPGGLFKSFMDGETDDLAMTAETLKIEQQVLIFFIYNSIRPSLIANARKLSKLLPSMDEQVNDRCPICGNMPGLGTLEDEGGKFLHCSFCGYKWRIKRLFCAFCGNQDHQTLGYFYSEEEPEYRVDTCDRCKNYIKTVDTRKLDRLLYPPLEQICTLHLDIKAEEAGFKRPISQDGNI